MTEQAKASGEKILDGVHLDELLLDLRHAIDGTTRPRPTRRRRRGDS